MAKGREVAEGTTFRLDTADLALEFGWNVESICHADEFNRDGVTIAVQYSPDDEVSSIARWGGNREYELFGHDSAGKHERLQIWLGGRAPTVATPAAQPKKTYVNFAQKPGDWTRDEFIADVEDPGDRAFLLRLLELIDANIQQPPNGPHSHLYFGKRPGGAMFVYPFGRRHPPFKFSVRDGQLMISGCWTKFPKVKGNGGFGALASMLDLDRRVAPHLLGLQPWPSGARTRLSTRSAR